MLDGDARRRTELVRLLDRAGHDVKVCDPSRLEHLGPGAFDVLVVAIEAGLSGARPLLRTLVEHRGVREPIVVTCGAAGAHLASRAIRQGLAFEALERPWSSRRAVEVLARAVRHADLLRELERTRGVARDVEQGLRLLGESAAILSHEIRTPLTGLRHALRAVGDSLGVEQRRLLDDHVDRLARIERLAELALSFARPLSLRRVRTPVAELLRSVSARWSATVRVDVDLDAGEATLHADRDLMERVLDNLACNAVEAGATRLRFAARARDAAELTIEVEDDGRGIEAHRRREVFAPFHTTKPGGSGIGLALCRRIVEAHGGELHACDGALGGACFSMRLPCHRAQAGNVVESAGA